MRFLYISASLTVVIGGSRFGIMIARPNTLEEYGSTDFKIDPFRKCKCQSSGLAIFNSATMIVDYTLSGLISS